MEKYISALLISFYVYGFAGWVWESFICPVITGGKIKNSGFLNGPIVPIYGVGALSVSLLFSVHETYLSIFIGGAFVACVIEYFTSWAMEKLYHRRWWDYSDKAFNVNGRVCLEGFLVFCLFSVVAVKFIQPALMERILNHGMLMLVVVATSLTTLLVLDMIVTIIALAHLEERLDGFIKDVEMYAEKAFDGFESGRKNFYDVLETLKMNDKPAYKNFIKGKNLMYHRIIKAFPDLTNKKK